MFHLWFHEFFSKVLFSFQMPISLATQNCCVLNLLQFRKLAKNPIGALKFQNSKDEIHQQVWRKVDLEKSQEIVNLFDGAQIVQSNPNYGFVVESSQAEGLKRKFCNLQTTGNLGQRFYALAFPKGSEWTEKVSKQILRYVENGDIYRLKNKWNNLPQNCVQTTENESTLVRTLPYRKLQIVIFWG